MNCYWTAFHIVYQLLKVTYDAAQNAIHLLEKIMIGLQFQFIDVLEEIRFQKETLFEYLPYWSPRPLDTLLSKRRKDNKDQIPMSGLWQFVFLTMSRMKRLETNQQHITCRNFRPLHHLEYFLHQLNQDSMKLPKLKQIALSLPNDGL